MEGSSARSEKDSGRRRWISSGTAGNGRAEARGRPRAEPMRPRFPEKTCDTDMLAVPKPTQVGGYKHTKARGRNLVKELGNMAP